MDPGERNFRVMRTVELHALCKDCIVLNITIAIFEAGIVREFYLES